MVDGVGRSNRDRRDMALEAANVLKARNPHSKVRDGETGETIEVTFAPLQPPKGRW